MRLYVTRTNQVGHYLTIMEWSDSEYLRLTSAVQTGVHTIRVQYFFGAIKTEEPQSGIAIRSKDDLLPVQFIDAAPQKFDPFASMKRPTSCTFQEYTSPSPVCQCPGRYSTARRPAEYQDMNERGPASKPGVSAAVAGSPSTLCIVRSPEPVARSGFSRSTGAK